MKTEVVYLDVPANHKYLNLVSSCIAGLLERVEGIQEPTIAVYSLQLAVQEACTNIVQHAYAGMSEGRIRTRLTLEPCPFQLIVELYDTGQPFDLDTAPEPDLGQPQVRGYGLYLMKQLLDEVSYHSEPGHNRWRLVKNL
jgi:serine/threonine-protein kinase RsbW